MKATPDLTATRGKTGIANRYLRIYLNRHLAGATVGHELIRRTARENRGTRYRAPLDRLATDIRSDLESLRTIMRRLDVPMNPVKPAVAWTLEKAARLKLNGRVRGYSPLSRLVELETLRLGVEGKAAVWRTLIAAAELDPRLSRTELLRLLGRATAQSDLLEQMRSDAAAEVTGGDAGARG